MLMGPHKWKQTQPNVLFFLILIFIILYMFLKKILDVNLFAFAICQEDFCSIDGEPRRLKRNLHETVCLYANANKLTSRIFVHKSSSSSTLPLVIAEYI